MQLLSRNLLFLTLANGSIPCSFFVGVFCHYIKLYGCGPVVMNKMKRGPHCESGLRESFGIQERPRRFLEKWNCLEQQLLTSDLTRDWPKIRPFFAIQTLSKKPRIFLKRDHFHLGSLNE